MIDMTPAEAVDVVSAAAREVAAAHAAIVTRVPGREAERVARTLEFESAQLNEAVTVLRKWTRTAALDAELLGLVRSKYGDEAIDELADSLRDPLPEIPHAR